MLKIPKHLLCSVALALLAECAWSAPSLLEQPAALNVRAQQSVLMAVSRADQRLAAVGEQGIVLLSDDHGAHWRQAKVPVSVALTNVRFSSAKVGWAVGHSGVVLRTLDGGETWVKRLDGKSAAQIELAAAKAALTAQGDSEKGQRRLSDAERLVSEGPDKPFLDVHFVDAQNGFVVGAYGLAFSTRDGGQTWQSMRERIDNPRGYHLYSIQRIGQVVCLAGEQGALYRSADGGQTFDSLKTPYAGTYFGVLVSPKGSILAYGLRGNTYRSADQGVSWQKVDTGLPVTLTAGTVLKDGTLMLVDETGRALRSKDDGQTFQSVPVAQPSSFTGVTQAGDGKLVLSGVRGITLLSPQSGKTERTQ